MNYLKKRSESEKNQEEINESLGSLGLERRDFLKFAGASAIAGMGSLFVPGISKAAPKPLYLSQTETSGDTLSVLPPWKPYPYEVVPIPVFEVGIPRGLFSYLMDYTETLPVYIGSFYISGVKGEHILVDSGPNKEDLIDKGMTSYKEIKPHEQQMKDMLGLTPRDITTVLYTQMHHDHNPLAPIYTRAKQIVQTTEWNMLFNPPACYRSLVNPEYMRGVQPTFVNGDVFNLFPGISLMYTPGHTSGTQSVVVDTKMGRVIICGTCCEERNFDPPEKLKRFWPDVLVPGLHIDSQQAYESLLRIKAEADYIVTPHDKQHYTRGVCPSAKWPKLGKRKVEYEKYKSDEPKSGYMMLE
jgi:glyoxylase-like metal-dependent hydrolase (beta-lactamase superfamily II)